MVERLTEIPLLWPPHTLAALGEGDKWALLEVLFEELADSLIHLGTFAGCLTRFQRLSPLGFGGVTLDGGDPDPEGASRLSFGQAPLDGVHDLLTEIFGVRFHHSMLPCSPSSPQHAEGRGRHPYIAGKRVLDQVDGVEDEDDEDGQRGDGHSVEPGCPHPE